MAFILNVTYTMKPGLRAEFLREVSEHGIQKAVLAEEGCLQYQYFEAVDEPDKLLLVERWTERKAQEVHMTQPHMVPLKEIKEVVCGRDTVAMGKYIQERLAEDFTHAAGLL